MEIFLCFWDDSTRKCESSHSSYGEWKYRNGIIVTAFLKHLKFISTNIYQLLLNSTEDLNILSTNRNTTLKTIILHSFLWESSSASFLYAAIIIFSTHGGEVKASPCSCLPTHSQIQRLQLPLLLWSSIHVKVAQPLQQEEKGIEDKSTRKQCWHWHLNEDCSPSYKVHKTISGIFCEISN